MTKTNYDGVYYVVGADGRKNFKVRFWVDGKEYKRTIGKEPKWSARSAWFERERLIEEAATGETVRIGRLDDMFAEYLEERAPKMSKHWKKNNYYTYRKHVSPNIGKMKADAIKRHQIQGVIDSMLNAGYKPKTAKDVKDMLSAFFRYYDLPNPAAKVELPKFDNAVRFELSLEECRNVYHAIVNDDNIKMRCFFLFLLHGRRRGEVLSLKIENIDFDAKTYTVEFGANKRRKTVAHPLTPILEEAVLEMVRSEKILSGFLFRSKRIDGPISYNVVDRHWGKLRKKAGVPSMRLHDLRHMIGSLGVNMGASLEQIGKVLDHTNIATTKRYSNVRIKQAGELLDELLSSLK